MLCTATLSGQDSIPHYKIYNTQQIIAFTSVSAKETLPASITEPEWIDMMKWFFLKVMERGSIEEKKAIIGSTSLLYDRYPSISIEIMESIPEQRVAQLSTELSIYFLKAKAVDYHGMGLEKHSGVLLDSAITLSLHSNQYLLSDLYSHLAYHYSHRWDNLYNPMNQRDSVLRAKTIFALKLCKAEAERQNQVELYETSSLELLLTMSTDYEKMMIEAEQLIESFDLKIRADSTDRHNRIGFNPWHRLQYITKLNSIGEPRRALQQLSRLADLKEIDNYEIRDLEPGYYIELADVYAQQDQKNEALAALERALSHVTSDNEHVRTRLVVKRAIHVLASIGEHDRAYELLDYLIEKDEETQARMDQRITEHLKRQDRIPHTVNLQLRDPNSPQWVWTILLSVLLLLAAGGFLYRGMR